MLLCSNLSVIAFCNTVGMFVGAVVSPERHVFPFSAPGEEGVLSWVVSSGFCCGGVQFHTAAFAFH